MNAVWYIVNGRWYCDHVGEDYDFTADDMIGMWNRT